MRNLIELKKFLESNFECVCFYNDPEDGYYISDKSTSINTLSVFFLNKIDLEEACKYKRVENAIKNIDLSNLEYVSGFHGNMLFTELISNGTTKFIINSISCLPLAGGLGDVIHYYLGIDINKRKFAFPFLHKELKFPKSKFKVRENDIVLDYIIKYFKENDIDLVNEENGFYVQKGRTYNCSNYDTIENTELLDEFGNEISTYHEIVKSRRNKYIEFSKRYTKSDWELIKEITGINLQTPRANRDFED